MSNAMARGPLLLGIVISAFGALQPGCSDGSSAIELGEPFMDAGGVCPTDEQCSGTCCSAGQVCYLQQCVSPGVPCADNSECADGEICDFNRGKSTAPQADAACRGGSGAAGRCMPRPTLCDGSKTKGCVEKCEVRGTGGFAPALKFSWGGQTAAPTETDVMMTPIVIQLDDDNCDGRVAENDIPEVVFTSFRGGKYQDPGVLHAISILDGKVVEKWSVDGGATGGGQLAGGNIDAVPGNEVVACAHGGGVRAYRGDGTLLWETPKTVACGVPAIADLDADGRAEVVVLGGILDGKTGSVKNTFGAPVNGGGVSIADITGDGKPDLVSASQVFDATGRLVADTASPADFNAIGDFDKDGTPEVVSVSRAKHEVSVWKYSATAPAKVVWLRKGIDINAGLAQHCPQGSAGNTTGGGPPVVADFNGDGTPDIGIAGGIGYAVIDGARLAKSSVPIASLLLWSKPTQDCSSAATGSSVFDFDGDGKAEVVYSDERYLRIYDGATGNERFKTCNTTGTLIEYPVIADIDNDGHADIVVASNAYAGAAGNVTYQCDDGKANAQAGVRIFGDKSGNWVRTRRVWNQHTYHVTNIEEDGTIPRKELPNWAQPGLNNFRQNKQPGSEFAAPDAVVTLSVRCGAKYGLVATVTNMGEATLPSGLLVRFSIGTAQGAKLGDVRTTASLEPGASEAVTLPLSSPPAELTAGGASAFAVVDPDAQAHPEWRECRTGNNTATVAATCAVVR